MPGKVDEKAWSRAKSQVRKEYPDLSEKDKKFWKLCMGIYKNIIGENKSEPKSKVESLMRDYA
ncbi:MAG TPA: hypothetical protein PLZ78_08810 [Spirochaetota bacterium]|nr:hypothetical protein [Spirochaetota bacterium]